MLNVFNLIKTMNGRTVIGNLSFTVRKGERVCLFAPSGAGKSTLIRILSGLDKKFAGRVSVNAERRATVFQEPGLFWYKTVAENIFYPLKLSRIAVDETIRQQYAEWMAVTKLKGFESYYPCEISGGMKQKAAIIRAFLLQPDLILMDEPFKSIDMAAKREIMAHIRSGYPDITLLLVTHHPDEIPLITDKVLLFREPQLSDKSEILEIAADTGLHELAERLFGGV
ncbi:ATP-binding cassette domain-containing protein [Desulfonema ishimotonii]|nr:ATP-binding cassette domain-containing protein [Desulfonema ishimotonii]